MSLLLQLFGSSSGYNFNSPRYGLNFAEQIYIGGTQPDTNNTDDGRFVRQQNSLTVPVPRINADGTWERQTWQSIRRSTLGMWTEPSIYNECFHSNDLSITHQLTVTGSGGTLANLDAVTASGGGSGTYLHTSTGASQPS